MRWSLVLVVLVLVFLVYLLVRAFPRIDEDSMAGTYRVTYIVRGRVLGTETLVLNADRSFTQSYSSKRGKAYDSRSSGAWSLVRSPIQNHLRLEGALSPLTMWIGESARLRGQVTFGVFRDWGDVVIQLPGQSLYYRKIK
jgi:hypothetical protein